MSKNGVSLSKPTLRVKATPPSECPPNAHTMITPPQTPVGPSISDSTPNVGFGYTSDRHMTARQRALIETPPRPSGAYVNDVEMGLKVCLGSGAWSEVIRGTLHIGIKNTTVAIKKPTYPGADKILTEEAKILSYIKNVGPSKSIVQFFGFDLTNTTIVMEYIGDMTLGQYSQRKKATRRSTSSARFEPVIGLLEWLDISKQLADTFTHLKAIGVVHGDVTWNNILMKEIQAGVGLQPVVIDFSSGHLEIEGYRPAAVSATTTAFCSPELLEAHIHRPVSPPPSPMDKPAENDLQPLPTYASDLYGVAMTLLSTAIGAEVYESAGRYAGIYARQGQPLEWTRNSDDSMLVGVRSVVSKMLTGCFGRVAEKRVRVEELRERIVGHIEGLI